MQQKLPGIIIDIDGVLIRGKEGIPNSKEALEILNKPLKDINPQKFPDNSQKLPFTLLTNGGGNLEKNHATVINNKMGIINESYKIKDDEVILNYTPLRPKIREFNENKQLILVGGSLNYLDLMYDMDVKYYITVREYGNCFPQVTPSTYHDPEDIQKDRQVVRKRLDLPADFDFDKEWPFQIFGIFMLYEPANQEECIQTIMDLCTTEDGNISKNYPFKIPEQHIPIYIVNNDITYKDSFQLPRLAFGTFTIALKTCAKAMHNMDLKITQFGKPEKIVFDYAKDKLNQLGTEISNFYMIGDNPLSDIRGANNSGVISILVQTGVYTGKENDIENPGKYFVKDFNEAVQLILELEQIK